METAKFNDAPLKYESRIPFEPSEQGLTSWLTGLPLEQNADSCHQILNVLRAIPNLELTQLQLFSFLKKISSKLSLVSEQCEKSYVDSGLPLDPEADTTATTVTSTWIALAENYASLGRVLLTQSGANNTLKASALFLSLQALGNALLNNAKIYRQPCEGYWLFCFQIYSIAENAGILDIEIDPGERKGKTVNAAFKHLLLFALSNTNQYRPREMKTIYSTLKRFSAPTKITLDSTQLPSNKLCTFNLNRDQGPHLVYSLPQQTDSQDRFISPLWAVKNLLNLLKEELPHQNVLHTINHSLFTRVVKSLGQEHKRKFNRKKEQSSNTGIISVNHLARFLYRKNEIAATTDSSNYPQKGILNPGGIINTPKFDLVNIGEESLHQLQSQLENKIPPDSSLSKILRAGLDASTVKKHWNNSDIDADELKLPIPSGEFEIIDSSAKGFQCLWKSVGLKAKVGDIIAIPAAKGDRVETGLIRRIRSPARNEVYLGIEIIGFESEAVRLVKPDSEERARWAIFLPGIATLRQPDSVVFNISDFSKGEFVILRRNKKDILCRLNKVINSTAAITHMELHYIPEP